MRIGDTAWTFGEPMQGFPGKGSWGSIEIIDDHTLAGVFPGGGFHADYRRTETASARIQLAKFVLNHRINATQFTPPSSAAAPGWKDVQDALFIGSVSQAQAVFRFAYDDDNLLLPRGAARQRARRGGRHRPDVPDGNATGDPLILKITPMRPRARSHATFMAVTCAATVLGTFDRRTTTGATWSNSPSARADQRGRRPHTFNAVLHDAAGDDTFTGLAAGNYDKWLPVELKLPAEPVTEPGNREPTTTTAAVPDGATAKKSTLK